MEKNTRKTVSKNITIQNRLGLHARSAAQLVKVANEFQSEIHLAHKSQVVNAKSIMGVLMLAAAEGTVLELKAQGKDAAEAVSAIEKLVNAKFGEE